jgi:threonine/homoserine/homoserine lactone efflux protein
METLSFLAQVLVLSLSGSMAPGPVTAATLQAGARRQHAGFWLAVGHGVVEFPLIAVIVLVTGAGDLLQSQAFRQTVGVLGGLSLVGMAALMLAGLRPRPGDAKPVRTAGPVVSGIVLTITSPYFLVWWATVGMAMATRASELGIVALVLFAAMHWVSDAAWLEILSLASYRGAKVFGPRSQVVVTVVCAAAMAVFGVIFLRDAIW